MGYQRIVIGVLILLLVGAVAWGFTQGASQRGSSPTPTITAVPSLPSSDITATPTTDTTPETPMTQEVKMYLVAIDDAGKSGEEIGCGDSLVPVIREIPQTKGVLRATLEDLFSLKERSYGQSGLYNALYNSDLTVSTATVENGTAIIRLSGQLSLGGVCDNPRVENQIKATALQFPTVKKVIIYLNDKPLSEVLSQK